MYSLPTPSLYEFNLKCFHWRKRVPQQSNTYNYLLLLPVYFEGQGLNVDATLRSSCYADPTNRLTQQRLSLFFFSSYSRQKKKWRQHPSQSVQHHLETEQDTAIKAWSRMVLFVSWLTEMWSSCNCSATPEDHYRKSLTEPFIRTHYAPTSSWTFCTALTTAMLEHVVRI